MGPILPFLSVIGKQLGVSEVALGLIMSITPILFFLAKPIFGFILDYFQSLRKTIFIALVVSTTVSFALLQFVPSATAFHQNVTCDSISQCSLEVSRTSFEIGKLFKILELWGQHWMAKHRVYFLVTEIIISAKIFILNNTQKRINIYWF